MIGALHAQYDRRSTRTGLQIPSLVGLLGWYVCTAWARQGVCMRHMPAAPPAAPRTAGALAPAPAARAPCATRRPAAAHVAARRQSSPRRRRRRRRRRQERRQRPLRSRRPRDASRHSRRAAPAVRPVARAATRCAVAPPACRRPPPPTRPPRRRAARAAGGRREAAPRRLRPRAAPVPLVGSATLLTMVATTGWWPHGMLAMAMGGGGAPAECGEQPEPEAVGGVPSGQGRHRGGKLWQQQERVFGRLQHRAAQQRQQV